MGDYDRSMSYEYWNEFFLYKRVDKDNIGIFVNLLGDTKFAIFFSGNKKPTSNLS